MISPEGIEMDPEKVYAVKQWETPTYIQDVQCFLVFANFHRSYIEGLSQTCTTLFYLLKKADVATQNNSSKTVELTPDEKPPFLWNYDCHRVFDELKTKFCTAPILKHFDPELETILETNASDYVVSGILSQCHGSILHPVAFLSEKIFPA